MSLRFDPALRFGCASCARCCRGHEIAVTAGEVETLRASRVERLFREGEGAAEGASRDPFTAVAGAPRLLAIRRRPDGACGFLSPANRCRIHEALGAKQKPLTCRMFPFALRPGTGAGAVLVASHACPSVATGAGPQLRDQAQELARLAREWERVHAPQPGQLELVRGRALSPVAAAALRTALVAMLREANLPLALARLARHAGDLTRWRVLRLDDVRRSEYVVLTSNHRGSAGASAAPQPPGLVARLLFRGFLFAVLALRERRASAPGWGQRLRLLGLLLHSHGLFPGVAGTRLGAARGVRIAADDPPLAALVGQFLRQAAETTGGGARPIADEVAFAAAQAQAALRVARMEAGRAGRDAARLEDVRAGLLAAADLDQVDHGLAARLLTLFAGPPADALDRLAAELATVTTGR